MYRTFFDLGGLLGPICISAAAASLGYIPSFYVGALIVFLNLSILPIMRKSSENTRPQREGAESTATETKKPGQLLKPDG